jgi:uncharacterized membrane protein YhhN
MKKFTILFFLIFIAELTAVYYSWRFEWLEYITKPLILISLIGFILVSTKGISCKFKSLLLIALFFSWGGDMFLMFDEQLPVLFIFGLASFLISHLLYIFAFNQTAHPPLNVPLIKKHPWIFFLLIVFGSYIFKKLQPGLGEMVVPVIVYLIAILSMFVFALNRWGKVSNPSFIWILIGAVFFILSDSILAFNKFHEHINNAHLIIMATYMFAQYAIVRGAYIQIMETK